MNDTYMSYESYTSHSKAVEMKTILVNPLDETPRAPGRPEPRLDSLAGKRIGLLDIRKLGGSFFREYLQNAVNDRYGGKQVVFLMMPRFSKYETDKVIK